MHKIKDLVVFFVFRIWTICWPSLLLVISLALYSSRVETKKSQIEANPNNDPKSMALSQFSMLAEEAEQPIYVVAEEEGKAVLPCNVTRPINDTIDLILWFRGDAETALYSLDARKAPIQRAKHFPSDDLSSRAYIDITGRPTALVVESVRAGDAGEYKCRIDFRKGRTQYRSVHLDVIVPPKEVIIMDEYGQRLRDPVGPYNEGAHLTVICEAEGGKPRPNIWWMKDSNLLDNSWILTPQGIVRNELVITRLLRTDHKSILTCQATNSNLTKPVTSSITLELNLRPLDVKIVTLHRPVLADRKIEVVCESGGSRPPALVTWWKGSKRLSHTTEQISKNENETISTVNFTPSIDDNGKILSCRADHAILPDSALEDSWILDVYYTPRLTVSLGASIHHDQVREGSNVSFECHVVANPAVSDVGWKFDHKTISTNLNNVYISENSLFLTKVTRQNSGRYSCVAANSEGVGESDGVNLKIQYAPICKPDQRIIFGVAKREPIKVPCEVDADPPQVTFRWNFNNSYEVVPVKNFVSAKTRSIATYAPRSKYGYGELYCWAKNKVGEGQPCIFSVIPAGPPQPVRNCLVGNQSTEGLVVKCEGGDDGGLEMKFYLEIYESEEGILVSNWSSSKAPLFEVSGLPIATSFVLVLYAANAKGRSNYVTLTANTLPFPNRGSEIGIKPVIYLLIAVVGSLVIAATLILIISKVRAIDQNKVGRNSSQRSQLNSKRSSEDVNAENARRCAQHNGNISAINDIPMGTLYVKTFDVTDGTLDHMNESWDQHISQQKYHITSDDHNHNPSHVSLEQRRTPEGDAFLETSNSDSTSTTTMCSGQCSGQPKDSKQINCYLMPTQSILMTDQTITCETPLMNGIYYTSFTNQRHRPTQQKHVTPLSTPV